MFKMVQERINNQYKNNFTVNVFDGLMKNYSKDPGKKENGDEPDFFGHLSWRSKRWSQTVIDKNSEIQILAV